MDPAQPELPIDPNKIISELATKLVSTTADAAVDKGKRIFRGLSDEVRLKLERTYREYLTCVFERFSKAKSFLIRDEATELYDFYVATGISCGNKKSVEAVIGDFSGTRQFSVLVGGAGSGKSMMMRHLFLDTIRKKVKVPIFVELRRFNDFSGPFLTFLEQSLEDNKFEFDSSFIKKAMKAGQFAIFLDGFDEIAASKRKQAIQDIQKLVQEFDRNIVVVSSRPDDEFSSWNLFDVWQITPLTLSQAVRLIAKVPAKNIDEETRDKFLADLKRSLFKKHESFLSNPLLLSIMVLTYASSGDVPQKITTFYENAYIALFERHDALKGAFKRDRRCDLDILEFKKIFSAFSTLTGSNMLGEGQVHEGINRSLRFPKTDALELIESSKEISDVVAEFSTEDFLQDCIKAVCLLIEDGLEITYAHRSFQEYFAAVFISSLDDIEAQTELIHSYFLNHMSRTIVLLYEINASLVEKVLFIPTISKMQDAIGYSGKMNRTIYKEFLRYCFAKIYLLDASHYKGELQNPLMIIPSKNPDGYLAAYVYAFIFQNQLRGTGLGTVSPETAAKLIQIGGKPLKLNNKTSRDDDYLRLIDKPPVLTMFAEDLTWGVTPKWLDKVFSLKVEMVERHAQIDAARRKTFITGLKERRLKPSKAKTKSRRSPGT